jgi:hypothetical protein
VKRARKLRPLSLKAKPLSSKRREPFEKLNWSGPRWINYILRGRVIFDFAEGGVNLTLSAARRKLSEPSRTLAGH